MYYDKNSVWFDINIYYKIDTLHNCMYIFFILQISLISLIDILTADGLQIILSSVTLKRMFSMLRLNVI